MNTVQKVRVGKAKADHEGQYKTLYKVFDEYGAFLYYQVGASGSVTEFLEDLEDAGYRFYDYKFDVLRREKIR